LADEIKGNLKIKIKGIDKYLFFIPYFSFLIILFSLPFRGGLGRGSLYSFYLRHIIINAIFVNNK
jgi:hypothetical protein